MNKEKSLNHYYFKRTLTLFNEGFRADQIAVLIKQPLEKVEKWIKIRENATRFKVG